MLPNCRACARNVSAVLEGGAQQKQSKLCKWMMSGAIQGHPGTSKDIQGHLGTSRDIQGHPGTSRDIKGHPGTSRDIQGHPRTSGDIQGHPGTSRDIQGHQGTSRDIQGHPGTSRDIQGHLGTSRDIHRYRMCAATAMEVLRLTGDDLEASEIPPSYRLQWNRCSSVRGPAPASCAQRLEDSRQGWPRSGAQIMFVSQPPVLLGPRFE